MLIPLEGLVKRGRVLPGPVLHVGAHLGEEADAYDSLGFAPVQWVEANHDLITPLCDNVVPRGHRVISALLSDTPGTRTFHYASNGQSSSYLELGTHEQEHPEVRYTKAVKLEATTIDKLASGGSEYYGPKLEAATFLNLDVQGAELDVLRGGRKFLETVVDIYTEVNDAELYKGCALTVDLIEFLEPLGFRLIEKYMTNHGWGDALFSRC